MADAVLIVDDSLTVRMDLSDAFQHAGFTVLLASSVVEARRALAENDVAIVILDVVLPDEDGIDLLREIRGKGGDDMPFVLLLSSEAEVQDRIRGLKTGADDYVGKPYDVNYVLSKSRELLHARPSTNPSESATVLVVDDSVTFREELRAALEAANYTVLTAENGEDGLRLAASARPHAVLVDNVMPGIDGSTMIRQIRLDAALRATPCVLLTASDDEGAELNALDAGADAFVRKADLELVLARVTAVLRSASAESAAASATLLGPKRILAVDDSPTYLNELSSVLRGEGYDVVLARSGEECLEMLAAQLVDCILLDLQMPGLDGIQTCQRVKAAPVVRDVPLIMLTASEDRGAMIEALGSGADDFISKSSELEVLKARVRAQLRRKQFEDEHRHIREKLLRSEMAANEARAARELWETRARLVDELEAKNSELTQAYQDIQTTQQQLVQAAKMASLGELVAGVAHEINNPLAFVISHLGTVQRSLALYEPQVQAAASEVPIDSWDRAKNRLEQMAMGLERMRELVVKLRTFSRLDEGEIKEMSLRESIDALLTILEHRHKGRIEIETRFGEPDVIECYAGLLTQAIMNVVANAIDAIEGSGKISISTGAEEGRYMIRVADTGSGIAEDVRDRVLDPFFTTKPVGEGTGLGLSITYSILRKHGGSIDIRSRPEGGTLVTLCIPLHQHAEPAN